MRVPETLDDRISFLVDEVDPEIRTGLQSLLRTLRSAEHPTGVVLGMSRIALQLFRRIYETAGRPWPSDNLYDVIIRAVSGDPQHRIAGYRILPEGLDSPVHLIRVFSNKVDHAAEKFSIGVDEAELVFNALLSVLKWYYCESGLVPRLPALYSFGPPIPRSPARAVPAPETEIPTNVPGYDSVFVGRSRELEQARFLLVDEGKGVVTITGTGGIGKTRFACEVARRLLPHFPGGAYFVELKDRETLDGLCRAVADAFDLRLDQEGEPDRLIGNFLRSLRGPVLLVLDNFEHLAVHAERTVRAWRSKARAVQMVVTSRVLLGIGGEYLFPLPSLETPSHADFDRGDIEAIARNPSVALFCQTASHRGRPFELTPETAWAVTEICRLLQGQPLPIILVAKRARYRDVLELVVELESRTLDAAHADGQTLRETIAWSYRLLSESEQLAFRQVCIFRDGFTPTAARSVVRLPPGDGRSVDEVVERLCDFSLVESPPRPGAGTRFTLFQTILDFGRELWPDWPHEPPEDLAARWAGYFADYVEEWAARVPTLGCNNALARLVEERENVLAAHQWAVSREDGALAARLILGYAPALKFRGPWQIRVDRFRDTIIMLGDDAGTARTLLHVELSDALWSVNQYQAAYEEAARGVVLARGVTTSDAWVLGVALHEMASRAVDVGHQTTAAELYREGLNLGGQLRNNLIQALHEAGLSSILDRHGRYPEARRYCESAVERLTRLDDRIRLAWAVNRLGIILWHEGRTEEAVEHFQRVERLFREVDYPRWYAGAITNQGLAYNELDRFDEATTCFRDAALIHLSQGNRSWWAVNQAGLGTAYLLQGRLSEALAVLQEALPAAEEGGYRENQALLDGLIGRTLIELGDLEGARSYLLAAVRQEARLGSRDRRVYGNLVCLATVLHRLGQQSQPRTLLQAAAKIASELDLTLNHPVRMVREDVARAGYLSDRP